MDKNKNINNKPSLWKLSTWLEIILKVAEITSDRELVLQFLKQRWILHQLVFYAALLIRFLRSNVLQNLMLFSISSSLYLSFCEYVDVTVLFLFEEFLEIV